MTKPTVSIIIIDYKKNNPHLLESFAAIEKQSFKKYEVILLTDYNSDAKTKNLSKHSYGQYVSPAKKRDDGAIYAKGEILAFLDDDAYPDKDWLKNIVESFHDEQIVAVGGPGITPPNTSWREIASGWASASPLGAGPYTYRFLRKKMRFVDDYPSMNLSVRRESFLAVGGFDSNYWPGEDTKLCLDLVNKTGKKILYNPKVLVYHHRRPLWIPHLRQNGNFGLHRGFFAKVLPKTSLRFTYFSPSLLLAGTMYLLLPISKNYYLETVSLISLGCYFLLVLSNSLWILKHSKSIFQSVISFVSVPMTHYWYGLRFLQGFFLTSHLKR